MVARKLPDGLPAGWTEQLKVLKTGRQIRSYTNSETDQKFFSKEDVIHYTKMRSTLHDEPQPTKRRSNNKHMQVVEVNDHPEWLPHGWIVEMKTRNSGSAIGRQYKSYVDLLTGCRFYSKPKVFQYLKSVKHKNCASKQKKIVIDMQSASKCCISSFSRRKIHSKQKVVVEKSTVDDLPPGWIKELRIRNTADRIRRDPYYIDPKSGYVFRSKKDVLLYLGTGEISRHAFKPKKRGMNDLNLTNDKTLPSSAAKWQKLEHPATRQRLFAGEGNSDMSSLGLPETEASKKSRGMKVSVETRRGPTDEILPDKHSMENVIENGIETKGNSRLSRSTLQKAEDYKRDLGKRVSVDSRPVSTPAADTPQQKNSHESELEKSSNKKTGNCSSKLKNKKEFTLPCRFSKRLAAIHQEKNSLESGLEKSGNGKTRNSSCKSKSKTAFTLPCRSSKRLSGLEPELVPNSVSSKQALQGATTKSCKSEAILVAGMNLDSMVDEASQQHKTGPVMELAHPASANTYIQSHEDPSNTCNKPLKDSAVPIEQLQNLETKKINEGSEPQLVFPFGDYCLDPCLEFAFKTLTGEIPLGDTSEYRPVSTPAADILQERSFLEGRMEKSSNRKTRINSRKSKIKKELHLPCRSSKRLAGQEPEMGADSMFTKRVLHIATRKSSESEAIPDVGLAPDNLTDGTAQVLEAGPEAGLAHHVSTDVNTLLHEGPSSKSRNPFEDQTVSKEQTQNVETERMNDEKPDPPLFFPFGDYWSDPCLEFAFKTLTGAIPVEDNLAIQGYFQQQLDTSYARRDASLALPDFGLPSFFQSDISSHFDSPEKQAASRQQLPMNPSFLPHGNVSLPSCSSISSKQPSLEVNKEIPGKVNS